jgi:hypothetical protein
MEPRWIVLLCGSCNAAYGKSRSSKDMRCTHCNHADGIIISRHQNAEDARKAITIANTPQEIRSDLEKWMKESESQNSSVKIANIDGDQVLNQSADEDGIVSLKSIETTLLEMRAEIGANEFAEQASAAGELLSIGNNLWRLV